MAEVPLRLLSVPFFRPGLVVGAGDDDDDADDGE